MNNTVALKRVAPLIGALGGVCGLALAGQKHHFATQSAAADATGNATLTLYQYQVCPYCNKTQAFLEYNQVPHKRVEVNPLSKKEMKFSSYKKVPFMVIENKSGEKSQVNESDDIIDYVSSQVLGESESPDSEDVKRWRQWTNDHLVHLLPPNIYRTPGEALQAFEYISNSSNFSLYERISAKYSGALAMYFIAKRSYKKYNIKDARGELKAALERWAAEGIPDGKTFHGGDKPDKADLAIFGVIRSIEDNYQTWTDMQNSVCPKFWSWYEKVKSSMTAPILQ